MLSPKILAIIGCGLIVIGISFTTIYPKIKKEHPMYRVNSPSQAVKLFPTSVEAINQLVSDSIEKAKKEIKAIIDVPQDQKTFANTFKAFDALSLSDFSIAANILQTVEFVSPDAALRDAAHQGVILMQDFSVDYLSNNRELYQALKSYAQHNASKEKLTQEQLYFMHETMDDFKRSGLDLPDDKLQQVKALKKELATLSLDFETNISKDNKTISVKENELAGLEADFIASLKKTDTGDYILGVDYPTYFNVMQNCNVSSTRKALFTAFNNRAYPVNELVLQSIIAKRDQLAKLLDFVSYAALDISDQMAKTPERAYTFINDLLAQSSIKEAQEFKGLFADLPAGVTLTAEGKLQPWDMSYTSNQYKKKHFDIDEVKIAEYFPMEKTVQGLLDIYQQFFSLTFKDEKAPNAWHEDVRIISVYDATNDTLLGYLFLDMHPRDNKYSHACHITLIPSTYDAHGQPILATSLVIANFPKSTESKPSLLKRADVQTFFHEFGHALHALLGRTHIASFAGTHVKRDFVEMPSQMLEEWLSDASILKQLSSHYVTGESLPDDLITRILALKHFDSGRFVQRQLMLSLLSLELYKEGEHKDMYAIYKDLSSRLRVFEAFAPEDHMYASFGHLTGYAAKYYGYMWSKVFALDLFDEIKKHGLLNPEIGKKYVADVIGKGGSQDPDELLKNFLGREPNQKAFLHDLGLNS
ncbi:MAG: Zn-dependent oligopeptidase [Candidatus Babeliales bacterium]|nr:Zn-dependent oligopeptidase [Candidatus Babeliales bacterium]